MSSVEVIKPGATPRGIFDSGCEVLVNATNCQGVMGAGLALAFANNFPQMFKDYQQAYKKGELKLGSLHIYKNPEINPKEGEYRWIVNFPTMHFPGELTRVENLESGLKALGEFVDKEGIKSIALPALGCGIGGFSWADFLPMVGEWAAQRPDVQVKVYEPQPQPGRGARK